MKRLMPYLRRLRGDRPVRYFVLVVLSFCWVVAHATVPAVAFSSPSSALPNNPAPLLANAPLSAQIQQGQQQYQSGQINDAIATWQRVVQQAELQGEYRSLAIAQYSLAIAYQDLSQWSQASTAAASAQEALKSVPDNNFLQAQVLNTQGAIQLQQGQADAALQLWKEAEKRYRSVMDSDASSIEFLVRNQLNQVQALRALGFYRRARSLLEEVQTSLNPLPDSALKLRSLQSLGGLLRLLGEEQQSETVLRKGVALADRLKAPAEAEALQLSLAQTLVQANQSAKALSLYGQIEQEHHTSQPTRNQVQAMLAKMELLLGMEREQEAADLGRTLAEALRTQQSSRWLIDTKIQFTAVWLKPTRPSQNSLSSIKPSSRTIPPDLKPTMAKLLQQSLEQARTFGDRRSESYALGTLGQLYEQSRPQEALQLTNQALQIAEQLQNADLQAQWHWQQGRLLAQQERHGAARTAYSKAFEILENLQQDLVSMGPEVQFSFRQEVEPAYRQYVQLLLQSIDQQPPTEQQQRLQRARQVMEALQLAELQNYFRQACLTYDRRDIEAIDPTAAVIYPILLDDSLEVILSLPNQPLRHYRTELSRDDRQALFDQFYSALNAVYAPEQFQQLSQQLYAMLVAPAAQQLSQASIQTLVFVSDEDLRNFPMAALHDGDRYLIESYQVALSPGLQLLNSQALQERNLTVLSAGLTEARQGFLPLPAVQQEVSNIEAVIPSETLLNQAFLQDELNNRLTRKDYPIVHLATHGKFSSQANETFLVTWDGRITVKELDELFRNQQLRAGREPDPIELLVLSACQTAAGDRRAALGMAGVAVRSGARSTLATLWAVNDQSTALFMSEFYRLLIQEQLPRGEAVRQAQLSLLKQPQYRRPYYWAPFVLVGNWQ